MSAHFSQPLGRFKTVLPVAVGLWLLLSGGAWAAQCAVEGDALLPFNVLDAPVQASGVPFTDKAGQEVRLTDYAASGKALVVNFWATWCAPCVKEMPQLDYLKAELKDDAIDVLTISNDRGGLRKVEPFFAKHGYKHLEMHLDQKGALARAHKIRGLPTTLLIDRSGQKLVEVRGLAEWDSPEIVSYIRRCLGTRAPA